MPGLLESMFQGVGHGFRGVKDTLTAGSTEPKVAAPESPAAAPFEMRDLTEPINRGLPKIGYRLGEGAPTLAAGVVGGIAGGAAAGPPGALLGGAGGAAAGTVMQSLGPIFAEELKKTNNPDEAWSSAVKQAATAGVFSAAGWAAFPLRFANGPIKNAMFQAFGIQPGLAVGQQAASNAIAGKPLTEGLADAYTSGAVMTAVPALGHAAVNATLPKPPAPPMQGPRGRIADRIVDGNNPDRFRTFDDAYTNLKDDLNPIAVIEREIMKLGGIQNIPAEESPYILSRLTRGSSGKALSFIDFETFDKDGNRTGDSLRKTLAPVKDNMDEFTAYITARRALELEGRGIKTGVPLADANWTVQQDRGRFEQTAKALGEYQDRVVDYLKDSGVLNDQQVAAMRQANRDYVPFYRLQDVDRKSGVAGAGTGLQAWNPIKKIRGSEREIINPIESIIKNTHLMIEIAERNRAMVALGQLAERVPGSEQFAERVGSKMAPIELSRAEKERLLDNSMIGNTGVPASALASIPNSFAIFRPNSFKPSANEIAFYRNGEREVWRVDPEVAKAVEGMDARNIGALEKIMSYPAKVLRAGVTLMPDFFVRNMIRDQLTAFAFSKNGYIPVYDFLKGGRQILGAKFDAWLDSHGGRNAATDAIAAILGKGEDFKQWLKSGGANAALVSGERDYVANEIRRITNSDKYKGIKGILKNPLDALQATSELFESATRVGEFAKAQRAGKNLPTSGYETREITLDFWRIGAKVRALNNLTAFLNATMEGLDRTARAFKERPVVTSLKAAGPAFMASMLLAWANKDDSRLDELPAWEKDFFWHIPTDKWEAVNQDAVPQRVRDKNGLSGMFKNVNGQWYQNNGTIYKIPKNFEMGLMFGSVPERMFDAYYKQNPDAWRNVGKSLQRAFGLEPTTFMPTFASPMLEHATNHSFFTERPLVPQAMTDRGGIDPKQQFNPFTTETAKLVGAGLDKIFGKTSFASPIIIENYVRAWTGSMGLQAMRWADDALKGAGVVNPPPQPAQTDADKFFIRGFVSRYPTAGAESIQKFYETYAERRQNNNTISWLAKRIGRPDDAVAYAQSQPLARGEEIYKAMNNQQKFIRSIYINPTMDPTEKRRLIDQTYLQMIELAKSGNQLFRATKDVRKKEETSP